MNFPKMKSSYIFWPVTIIAAAHTVYAVNHLQGINWYGNYVSGHDLFILAYNSLFAAAIIQYVNLRLKEPKTDVIEQGRT